jgi:RNA-binding protein YhbY
VAIGQHGLTPAVLHEIDVNLVAHELIKIRVFGDNRDEREALLARICGELDAAPVQHLGKILTIWRPAPPPEPEAVAKRPGRKRTDAPAPARGERAKKTAPPQAKGGSAVRRAPRRGRSVIVEPAVAGNPRRRHATGAKVKAQSRQGQAPHGKSASSRVGASGARRRRKA